MDDWLLVVPARVRRDAVDVELKEGRSKFAHVARVGAHPVRHEVIRPALIHKPARDMTLHYSLKPHKTRPSHTNHTALHGSCYPHTPHKPHIVWIVWIQHMCG